jgi:NADH-quinone oxidoreductase subunit N
MITLLDNLHLALPEMIVLFTAVVSLLIDLFSDPRHKPLVFFTAVTGLAVAVVVHLVFLGQYSSTILHDLFISDDIAQLMKIFIEISMILSLFYSRHYLAERQIPCGDFYVLSLFSTLGMMVLVSAHSMLTIFLGLELMSLPLYALTAIRRSSSDASEAAMKYFVMGAIASGLLLYGMSLLYAATGQLDLHELSKNITLQWQEQRGLISFALVFILAGMGFKLALVPFHMWAPDVYQGAPTSTTLLIATAPKIAALAMMMRFLMIAFPEITAQWQSILVIMSLLSVALGNLLAITQSNLKRLLAYSTISHMGYVLFGLIAATPSGYAAALFYALIYSLMSAAGFGLLVILSHSGKEIENVNDLKGLNQSNPWLAFMMMVVMLSMAGIPPLVGFFSKLLVLKALVDAHWIGLAIVGLVFAVIGAFYYLRIIKVMYFEAPEEHFAITLPRSTHLVFSLHCLSLLVLGIFPGALVTACINALS